MESLSLAPWTAQRREDLLELFDWLDSRIAELGSALEREVAQRPEVLRLMTHRGWGQPRRWRLRWSLVQGNGLAAGSR